VRHAAYAAEYQWYSLKLIIRDDSPVLETAVEPTDDSPVLKTAMEHLEYVHFSQSPLHCVMRSGMIVWALNQKVVNLHGSRPGNAAQHIPNPNPN
jgi:hypothetical protein